MDVEKYKQCSFCKDVFPKEEFYKNRATKDGYDSYCKSCRTNKKRGSVDKGLEVNGRLLRLDDFYYPEKKWKKLETWNKFDPYRLDELLYNGGDITEVFFDGVVEKKEWEKNKKKKRKWGN